MISKSLSTSRRFAQLADEAGALGEFAQALFPLLVAHVDDHGRMAGDTFTIKHLCHPTSPRALIDFELALDAMARVGLIVRSDDDLPHRLQVVRFDEHQVGLHKRTDSKFQEIPELPGNSGIFPLKRTELNRTEEKRTQEKAASGNGVRASVHVNGTTDPEIGERAAKFLELYAELYPKHRNGARFLPKPALDWPTACDLVSVWPDDRLEKLAIVFLKTDHEFATNGSRTIRQFAALASWCDDRLRQVETERAR